MRLDISPRALREIERKAIQWARNSTIAPTLFMDEVEGAGRRLLIEPRAGVRWVSPKGRVLLRLLLVQTQNHLYYSYDPEAQVVRIWCVWGARREYEPRL